MRCEGGNGRILVVESAKVSLTNNELERRESSQRRVNWIHSKSSLSSAFSVTQALLVSNSSPSSSFSFCHATGGSSESYASSLNRLAQNSPARKLFQISSPLIVMGVSSPSSICLEMCLAAHSDNHSVRRTPSTTFPSRVRKSYESF